MSTTHTKPAAGPTQSVSSILRAATQGTHDEISKSKTATYLTNGELHREEYIRYLMMLWHIYKVLEEGLAANANDHVLSPTYNPALLARCSVLSSDISFLLGVADDDVSWKTHEIHQTLISSPPPAFQAYISRLNHVTQEDPRRLLAHSYIRYMGDLSGGQIMKNNIRKAYGLADGQGIRFYEFAVLGSEGQMNPALADKEEMRKIKEWFKSGIDAGVGNDIKMKEALLDETKLAYSLHKDIFDEINASSSKAHESSSKMLFSVSSVLTLMLAVGLAHFLFVVGGLGGSRGYAKLEAVQAWIANTVSSE